MVKVCKDCEEEIEHFKVRCNDCQIRFLKDLKVRFDGKIKNDKNNEHRRNKSL